MARAVESILWGLRPCVCTRAVAHRAGGQHLAADTAGQGAILAGAVGPRILRGRRFTAFNHTPHDFLRWGSVAEVVVSKLERLALKAESSFLLCLPFCASIHGQLRLESAITEVGAVVAGPVQSSVCCDLCRVSLCVSCWFRTLILCTLTT